MIVVPIIYRIISRGLFFVAVGLMASAVLASDMAIEEKLFGIGVLVMFVAAVTYLWDW